MKYIITIVLFIAFLPIYSQVGSFEEMEFEVDSAKTAYRPSGKNYVLLKSKRGTAGLNKTAAADAITTAEVTEIVLVFSETDPSTTAEREESIRERWENLLLTYPELFQFSTTYKNFCQCNYEGDAESFKASAGFYIYVNGEVPKVEEPKAASPAPPSPVAKTEEKKATPVEDKKAAEPPAPPAPSAVSTPAKQVSGTDAAKSATPPPSTEPVAKQEAVAPPPSNDETSETPAEAPKPVAKKKKIDSVKPRKAKDKKACRPACYGWGDEDLIAFFKDNIQLTRKQRRKAKNWVANVKLQIHFDGVVKKEVVTGSNETFNQTVQDVLKRMNRWNAAVKNGVAVKSEIKFTLKYDKVTKCMKPYDFIANPKPSSKCPCVSDGEIFKDASD